MHHASVVHDDIKQKGVEGEPLRKSLEGGLVVSVYDGIWQTVTPVGL